MILVAKQDHYLNVEYLFKKNQTYLFIYFVRGCRVGKWVKIKSKVYIEITIKVEHVSRNECKKNG